MTTALWSPNCNARSDTPVIWLAVHTAEGATTAVSLAHFLSSPANQVSYHVVCDDTVTIQCVAYDHAAWAMLSGNVCSDQICCTGFAAWTREQWLQHKPMLDRIAVWLKERASARKIPLIHIGPEGVTGQQPGIIGHWDYTRGAHEGTHTDPGPNFPWDYVVSSVNAIDLQQRKRKVQPRMVILPPTPLPSDPNTEPASWPQRNYDIPFDVAGGWEGDCALSFGGQDWPGRTADNTRTFLHIASWVMSDGKLTPVKEGDVLPYVRGKGRVIEAHRQLGPWTAPRGAIGITLNYAAPGAGYAAEGRSS